MPRTRSHALNQEKTVDLSQDLNNLGGWGFTNIGAHTLGLAFPGLGCLTGILLTCINPLWIVSSAVFAVTGIIKLKKGDIAGAERALAHGRLTNWLLVFAGFVAWMLFFKSRVR